VRGGYLYMATSGYLVLATRGYFFMATDRATRSPPTERLGVDGHTVRKWVGRRPTPLYEPISVVSVVGRTCVGSTFVRPT